jgi:uncharacterized protein YggU (UPF0235/DUF167 family)
MKKYSILAKTGSKFKAEVIKTDFGGKIQYIIYVREKPLHGEANKKIIELFAKELGVPKSRVSIISGKRSKYKTLGVEE